MTKMVYCGGLSDMGEPMPASTDAYKLNFPLNVPVEVTDPHVVEKLKGNKYFRVATADDEPKPKAAPFLKSQVGHKPPAPSNPAAE